ncbi:MAG TPA: hypothetical protein VH138_13955, partial [Vicinamibacterales bacterium]|nr:hypothetical protein [Vicinamibacterales bacterium]
MRVTSLIRWISSPGPPYTLSRWRFALRSVRVIALVPLARSADGHGRHPYLRCRRRRRRLLLFVGVTQFTGFSDRMRFGGALAMIAGTLSGLLGGLVGNQGGIRSAALLGFEMPKETFVATATA